MNTKISINCHSSIKIIDKKIIYFDPYQIEEESHDADMIFITHDHYDHLDFQSISKIKKDDTVIILPNTCARKLIADKKDMTQYIGVNPNEQYFIKEINVTTIPSYNTNKEFHKKTENWVGYIIELNNEKIYVSGDTDINEDIKKVKCDIALIPIGGTYTMNKEEAAELINIIKPKVVIPTHYAKIVGELKDGEDFKSLINKETECHLLIK